MDFRPPTARCRVSDLFISKRPAYLPIPRDSYPGQFDMSLCLGAKDSRREPWVRWPPCSVAGLTDKNQRINLYKGILTLKDYLLLI